MRSFRVLFDRQARYIVAIALLMLASIMPALASAAQVTERSIALSSSSADADSVTYKVKFTSDNAAGAFVVDFCTNSPLIGQSCTAPDASFSVAAADSTSSGFTNTEALASDTNTFRSVGTIAADTAIEVDVTGINNPATSGVLYARIVTYADETAAEAYTSTDLDNGGAPVDDGSVALSITPTIGVTAAVLESMTFCVSKAVPTASCGGTNTPTVKLGNTVGTSTVLDSALVYTDTINTQISTNAVGGAIVSLKSNTTGCGGLSRAGAATFAAGCGIAPALTGDIAAGEAEFGVKTATAAGVSPSNGTLRPYDGGSGAYYSNTVYKLNYVSGDGTGVTSTYGDPFLDTNSAPVNNMGMEITFGASAANNTPAGQYSANMSMIATGKF
jgi:hypothetical protein